MGNKIIHVEVTGKDGPALKKFYSDVFGWSLDTNNPGGYGMLRQDDLTAGIGPALLGSDPFGNGVPISNRAGPEAVPYAWGHEPGSAEGQ